MAGIGFKINEVLRAGSASDRAVASGAAVFISAGPALSVILTLFMIAPILKTLDFQTNESLLFAIITYCFMASMILFAPVELLSVRYLADIIYVKNERILGSFFVLLTAASCFFCSILIATFFWLCDLNWQAICLITVLMNAIIIARISIIFLSASKSFLRISVGFVYGMLVSVIVIPVICSFWKDPLLGPLTGFTIGQSVTALYLARIVIDYFQDEWFWPPKLLSQIKRFRLYALIGLSGSLTLWVDKIIYWFTEGIQIKGYLYSNPVYDTAIMLGYLQTIPLLSFFLVKVETNVFLPLRRYLALLEHQGTYFLIDNERKDLDASVKNCLVSMSGVLCISMIYGIAIFPTIINVNSDDGSRLTIETLILPSLAVGLNVYALLIQTILLYFNQSKVVAILACSHFLLNASLTIGLSWFGYPMGIGYLVSSGLISIISTLLVLYVSKHLTFFVMSEYIKTDPNIAGM